MWLKSEWSDLGVDTESKNAEIAEIIQICDNLFYGDYYEKGGDFKTKDELTQRIKSSLGEDFIEFYGERYADKITQAIEKQNINFAYQIIGKNSIEDFLNKKEREHLESKGLDLKSAKILSFANSMILINGNFHIEKLIENQDKMLQHGDMTAALEFLGYDKSIFESKDVEKVREFVNKVKELAESKYSDIPEVDRNMKKLSRFVSQYRRDLEQEREKEIKIYNLDGIQYLEGEEFNQALSEEAWRRAYASGGANATPEKVREIAEYYYNKFRGILDNGGEDWILNNTKSNDPIIQANDHKSRQVVSKGVYDYTSTNSALYDRNCSTAASHRSLTDSVSLGINPSDWVIIHEFIHAIEDSGFQRNDKQLSKEDAPYTHHLREHEMFDEVCVDYFAKLIYEARVAKGKGPILNQTPFSSSYSVLFPIMAPFIERMMPDIKAAKMVEKENPGTIFQRFSHIVKNVLHKADPDPTPASFFSALIGKEHFEEISLLCNNIVELKNPKNVQKLINALQENGVLDERDLIDSFEKDLSLLTGVVINDQDMAKLENEKGKKGIFGLLRSIKAVPEVTAEAIQQRDQTMVDIKYVVDNPELEKWAEIAAGGPSMDANMQKDVNQASPNVSGMGQNAPGVTPNIPGQTGGQQPVQQNSGNQTSMPTPTVRNDDMVM